MFSRTWRDLRGGARRHGVQAAVIRTTRPAVDKLVKRVAKATRQAGHATPRSTSTGGVVDPTPSRPAGIAVRNRCRAARSRRRCSRPAPRRSPVRTARRWSSRRSRTEQLAAKYPAVLIVNRSSFTLKLYKNLKLAKTYTVAVGQVGPGDAGRALPHPEQGGRSRLDVPNSAWAGDRRRGKVIPGGTPENPIKARWLGIFDGAGIHGTDPTIGSIGHAASHGCVRMQIPDVMSSTTQVPVGAPIYIG